jgi:lysylphosphatidylglycerol synthetase-like protein (DUF2156 family)
MSTVLRRVFLVATPLALAVALWWHPAGGTDVYEDTRDDVGAWLFVHTTFLFFIPLLGIATYLLLKGLESRAATVSRVALVSFLVFYTAYEVTVGLGTGVLDVFRANAQNHFLARVLLGIVSLLLGFPNLLLREGGGEVSGGHRERWPLSPEGCAEAGPMPVTLRAGSMRGSIESSGESRTIRRGA